MDLNDLQSKFESLKRLDMTEEFKSQILYCLDNETHEYNRHRRSIKKSWILWVSILTISCALATGFVNANIKLPVIGKIFNLFHSQQFAPQSIQSSLLQKYTLKVNKSVTYQGITLTIGNLYSDSNHVTFDLVESFEKNAKNKPRFVSDDNTVSLQVNQKKLVGISGGEFVPTMEGGFAGIVYYNGEFNQPYEPLPQTYILSININKIGNVKGNWSFVIPVSQDSSVFQKRIYSPMKSVTSGGVTFTVKKVTITQPETTIEYEIRANAGQTIPVIRGLYIIDDKGKIIGVLRSNRTNNPIYYEDGLTIQDTTKTGHTPSNMPKTLTIVPFIEDVHSGDIQELQLKTLAVKIDISSSTQAEY